MRNNRKRKQMAQSVLEYAMVIACLAGALLVMRIYVTRGMQGRVRDAADEIGEQYSTVTTTSSLTQTTTTTAGKDVITTGRPKFIDVQDPKTGITERREIMEIERKEPMTISIGPGSFEKTGDLSSEELFGKKK